MKADLAKLADKTLRTPKCSRCRNHGFLVPVKGHAGKCRWKQCSCDKCYLITERQKIMAAQKVLKKQAAEEEAEQEAALRALPAPPGRAGLPERPPPGRSPGPSAFQPVAGRGHVGLPGSAAPLAAEAAEAAGPPGAAGRAAHPELCRPRTPLPAPPLADFGHPLSLNSDCVAGAEYMEREPSKLYPGCSTMHSYRPFPLGYQDASAAPGIPPQRGFRHVSYSHYHGSSLVFAEHPVPSALHGGAWTAEVSEAGDFQPSFYSPPPPPQPQFLPPGFLSALHFLPPPPPPPPPATFSLTLLSDTDKESTDDQDAEVPCEPGQPSSQEQSN